MNRWHFPPVEVYALVEQRPSTVLLECAKLGPPWLWTRLFTDPARTIAARQPAEIPALSAEIESAVAAGNFIAGFFIHECGACFEPTANLRPHPVSGQSARPLAWFGVYECCHRFDHQTGTFMDGDPPEIVSPEKPAKP